jgi:hypothetical protein
MSKADLEEFYQMIAVGDTVKLVGERNDETAQLFGDGQNPAAPQTAQAVETATATTDAAPTQAPVQLMAQTATADANFEVKTTQTASADAVLVASR